MCLGAQRAIFGLAGARSHILHGSMTTAISSDPTYLIAVNQSTLPFLFLNIIFCPTQAVSLETKIRALFSTSGIRLRQTEQTLTQRKARRSRYSRTSQDQRFCLLS